LRFPAQRRIAIETRMEIRANAAADGMDLALNPPVRQKCHNLTRSGASHAGFRDVA